MNRRLPLSALGACAALLVSVLFTACGAEAPAEPMPQGPLGLYRTVRCDSCHGKNAEGIPRMGPALNGTADNWTKEELVRYLADPAPFRRTKPHLEELSQQYFAHMRAFPELNESQREVLADWLLQQ